MSTPAIRRRTKANAATGSVSRAATVKDNATGEVREVTNTNEVVSRLCDHPNPAYVSVSGGITKSLGNYEFVRIDVGVKMPCAPDRDSVVACYRENSDLVDTLMDEEFRKVMAAPVGG